VAIYLVKELLTMLTKEQKDMLGRLLEVEAVLSGLIAEDATRIDVVASGQRLEDCFVVLRRETGFKPVLPGEREPLVSYDLVRARDSVESAMGAFAIMDVAQALKHCRAGLLDVQRLLRRQKLH
jgi:hypothetical protein